MISARFGRIDILINNAGVNTLDHRVSIDQFPIAEWDRVTRIDLDGPFLMSRAVLPAMLEGAQGAA
jgi:NAD(P)-dependent dehydrogenase (short-subunit alcohol dehydrogenase family)